MQHQLSPEKPNQHKMLQITTIFISVINQLDAQNFCFTISLLVNYCDKYTEMHGQHNVKISSICYSFCV